MSFLKNLFFLRSLESMREDKLEKESKKTFSAISDQLDRNKQNRNTFLEDYERDLIERQNERMSNGDLPYDIEEIDSGLIWLDKIDFFENDMEKACAFQISFSKIVNGSYRFIGDRTLFQKERIEFFINNLIEKNPLNYRFFIHYGAPLDSYLNSLDVEISDFDTSFLHENCSYLGSYNRLGTGEELEERIDSTSTFYRDYKYFYNNKVIRKDYRIIQYIPIKDRNETICKIALDQSDNAAPFIPLNILKKLGKENLINDKSITKNTALSSYISGKYKRNFFNNEKGFRGILRLMEAEHLSEDVILETVKLYAHEVLKDGDRLCLYLKLFETNLYQYFETDFEYNIQRNSVWSIDTDVIDTEWVFVPDEYLDWGPEEIEEDINAPHYKEIIIGELKENENEEVISFSRVFHDRKFNYTYKINTIENNFPYFEITSESTDQQIENMIYENLVRNISFRELVLDEDPKMGANKFHSVYYDHDFFGYVDLFLSDTGILPEDSATRTDKPYFWKTVFEDYPDITDRVEDFRKQIKVLYSEL